LLPGELLSLLADLILNGLAKATYVQLATHLLTLDSVILPVGLMAKDTTSSLQSL
jgi:hypothetical protein